MESRVLRQDGDYWTVTFAGKTVMLRDMKGLQYLAALLRQPGKGVPVEALVGSAGTPAYRRAPKSATERARVTVTKGIKAALARIAMHHPALATHLDATVRRGYVCRYTPEEGDGAGWTI